MPMKPLLLLCTVVILPSVDSIARSMGKRSDDPNPLESVVLRLSSDVESLKAQVSELAAKLDTKDHQVAFLAQLSNGKVNTPASGPFQFDVVIFNDGNGYDPAIGIFTAPMSGVYMFAAQFFTGGRQDYHPLLDIKLNGDILVRLAFDTSSSVRETGEDSDSMTISVKLQAGDRVWVESAGHHSHNMWGMYHTFFSGALLYST